jgi:CRP/FNR family transcriptional regulator, cyclic AMP receptor protein
MRMHDRLARALSKIEPFMGLDARSLEAVAASCRFDRYDARRQIIAYQDASADVFFIVSGIARVVIHSASGKEISYRDLEAGEMFGELAAIDGEQRSASVVAVEDTLLVAMPEEAFREAIRKHPSVAEAVLQRLTRLVRLYSQRLYEMRTLDVQSRIRAELVRLAEDSLGEDNTATISPLPTSADIAARVNTRREAVSRELASLTRRGLIKRHQKSLTIRDFAGLNRLVESMLAE